LQCLPLSPTPLTSSEAANSSSTVDLHPCSPTPVSKRAVAQSRRRNKERAVRSSSVRRNLPTPLPSAPITSTSVVTHHRRRKKQRIVELAHEEVSLHLFLSFVLD
jgi:hypothetical protein